VGFGLDEGEKVRVDWTRLVDREDVVGVVDLGSQEEGGRRKERGGGGGPYEVRFGSDEGEEVRVDWTRLIDREDVVGVGDLVEWGGERGGRKCTKYAAFTVSGTFPS
jgi:hypothetical protein